jgi:hypothetical protein
MRVSRHIVKLVRTVLGMGMVPALVASIAPPALAQYTATVDLNTRYQTFEGWGTSLAWWANVVGGYPDTYRNDYVSKFFDPVNGLGLNVVRYNIGGGENPVYLPPNSPVYLPFRTRVPGFEASPGIYDWTQDANQRLILQQALQQGANIAEAFSNSPPYWMTNSGSVTGGVGGANNLNPSYTSEFADYLTTVVQHYHDAWGIIFRTLEPFNEPNAGYWHFGNGQEGCDFDPATQNTVAKAVGASLVSKGMNYTTLSTSDETSINIAVATLGYMDATALGYMSQINTHSYGGSERTQLLAAATADQKRLWLSEYGDGDATGLTTAAQILKDVNIMQAKSWVYWQAVDSATGWGFFNNALNGTANYSYQVNKKYYVMGNFTRFIRPGYQIVSISDSNSIAAYDGQGTVVIVTVSRANADQGVTYALNNFGPGPWQVAQYRTSSTENLVSLPPFTVTGNSFTKDIPPNSVTTFVLTNGQSGPFVSGKTYTFTNANSGDVLEVRGSSTAVGQTLDQAGSNGASNQQWIASAAGANWVFTNANSGLAVDVSGAAAGSSAIQNIATHNATQVWTLTAVRDGTYKLVNSSTGLDLEVAGASTAAGAGIDQGSDDGGSNQHWNITEVQIPGAPADTQVTMSSFQSPIASPSSNQLAATVTTTGTAPLTGSVTFYDGSSPIGTATNFSSGNVASLSVSLPIGTHYVSAVYSGDANHNASSSTAATVVVTGQKPPLFEAGMPYILINVKSGLVLEAPGSTTTVGAHLDQHLTSNGTNQRWIPTASGADWIWTNVNSGLALDLAGTAEGSSTTQNTADGSATQTWNAVAVGDGSYKLVNASTGFDMEVSGASSSNGADVDQWPDNGGANQHWIIAEMVNGFTSGKTYVMANVKSGLVLDIASQSKVAGTVLEQYTSNNGTNQRWVPTASGSSWIWTGVNSGLDIDVAGSVAGSAVTQNTPSGSATQMWNSAAVGDGSYKLVNASTGLDMEVSGASTANGAKIDQQVDNSGANQHWIVAQFPSALAVPTISWVVPRAITYGTALSDVQVNATATVNGKAVPGTFSYTPSNGTILGAGSQLLTVSFTPTDSANYTTASATVNLTVNSAPLTVTADNQTKVYGAPVPAFTVSYAGFVNGDTPSSLGGSLGCATAPPATVTSPVGLYSINCSGQTSTNYTITYVPGQLSIIQDPTSTTVSSSTTPTILGQPVTLSATVTAAAPGSGTPTGSVTFKDGTTTLGTASLTSGQTSFTTSTLSVGSHAITATYGGDAYFAASSGSFTQQVTNNICALYDQTKSVNSGANVPIKLYLCDINGNDVSSPAIALHVTQVVGVSGYSGAPESPGSSTPDADFVFDSSLGTTGGYHFNLKTMGLAPGTYSLQFVVTNDTVTHSVNFGLN